MARKRIVGVEVVKAGSNPDVDSDFNTVHREAALAYVTERHGLENVANIITYGTLAAKSAFKNMCTIYQKPFAAANKIAALVPPPLEGEEVTLTELFDPASARYPEGSDFRSATAGDEWKDIIRGAKRIEGRVKSTGMHPCGVVISSKPLQETIPLQVRQDDGRIITQWTYKELEDLGLIKFDFLGLDTVDLIQHTVEYIVKQGKTPPNMVELIHGPMDDEATYKMFARGDTVGIFQFGSDMVRDYCRLMQPNQFNDLAAATSLMRPGPMGMQSHVRYAFRKNGKEPVRPLHPAFKGSVLDEILGATMGVLIFQEQIQRIANRIGGMSLQEGDGIRKAVGKKDKALLDSIKDRFVEGGVANGYPLEAMELLWSTIESFANYGFNRSHAVAYAMNSYQAAYLKTHYPVEFMAALIAQNVGVKDKILTYLKEARRMGLKVGTVDINLSDVRVAPAKGNGGEYDIVYGLSGVNSVSVDMATLIVEEREKNGPYTSLQDVINRCSPLGVSNRKIYENLALAGAFDAFSMSRQAAVENLQAMLQEGKTKNALGTSLFDLFEEEGTATSEMDLSHVEEYAFVEKLQREANVIGLYLTSHPLSRVGRGLAQGQVQTLKKVRESTSTLTVNVVGSITEMERKTMKRGGKAVRITIDDGSAYIDANLQQAIIKGLDTHANRERLKNLFQQGDTQVTRDVTDLACSGEYQALPELEKNALYFMNITYRPPVGDAPYGARVNSIRPLHLSHGGRLPVRVRLEAKNEEEREALKSRIIKFAALLAKKHPGSYPLHAAIFTPQEKLKDLGEHHYYRKLVTLMGQEGSAAEGLEEKQGDSPLRKNLFGAKASSTVEGKSKKVEHKRALPLQEAQEENLVPYDEEGLAEVLTYFPTGFTVDKTAAVEELLSNKFGMERVDFGVFNQSMNEKFK